MLGATGTSSTVRKAHTGVRTLAREHGGVVVGDVAGREWRNNRFCLPYLRNTLWEKGWAVETLETATTWSNLIPTARAVLQALRTALEDKQVLAMVHVSHVYPTGASLYFTYLLPARRRPRSNPRTLANSKIRRPRSHRRARRHPEPPARRRHRPSSVYRKGER